MSRGFGTTLGAATTDIVTSNYSVLTAGLRSYSIWANINGSGGGALGRLFDNSQVTTLTDGLFMNSSATVVGYQRQFSSSQGLWSVTLTNNRWYNIIVTYDAGNVANTPLMYVDGALPSMTTGATPTGTAVTTAAPYYFGNRLSSFNRNFDGMLAQAAIWDGILLTAADARAIAAGCSPLQIRPDALALYLPLDGINNPEFDYRNAPASVTGCRLGTSEPPARNYNMDEIIAQIATTGGSHFVAGAATFSPNAAMPMVGKAIIKRVATFSPAASFPFVGRPLFKGVASFAPQASLSAVGKLLRKTVATFSPSAAFAFTGSFVAAISRDFIVNEAYGTLIQKDTVAPVAPGTSIARDAIALLENATGISGGGVVPVEAATSIRRDEVLPAGYLTGILLDTVMFENFSTLLVADSIARTDLAQVNWVNMTTPAEAATGDAADTKTALASLTNMLLDVLVNIDYSGAITLPIDMSSPVEWEQAAGRSFTMPIEPSTGIAKSEVENIDYEQRVAFDYETETHIEWGTGIAGGNPLGTDRATGIKSQMLSPVEYAMRFDGDSKLNVSITSQVLNDIVVNEEYRSQFFADIVARIQLISDFVSDKPINLERSQNVRGDTILPLIIPDVVGGGGTIPAEYRTTVAYDMVIPLMYLLMLIASRIRLTEEQSLFVEMTDADTMNLDLTDEMI